MELLPILFAIKDLQESRGLSAPGIPLSNGLPLAQGIARLQQPWP